MTGLPRRLPFPQGSVATFCAVQPHSYALYFLQVSSCLLQESRSDHFLPVARSSSLLHWSNVATGNRVIAAF